MFCCLPEAAGWYCKASVLGRGATEASCVVSTELGEVADIPITHIIPLSHSSGITVSIQCMYYVKSEMSCAGGGLNCYDSAGSTSIGSC